MIIKKVICVGVGYGIGKVNEDGWYFNGYEMGMSGVLKWFAV